MRRSIVLAQRLLLGRATGATALCAPLLVLLAGAGPAGAASADRPAAERPAVAGSAPDPVPAASAAASEGASKTEKASAKADAKKMAAPPQEVPPQEVPTEAAEASELTEEQRVLPAARPAAALDASESRLLGSDAEAGSLGEIMVP